MSFSFRHIMATRETFNRKFSGICRLCLKQDGVMASIFQTVDTEDGEFSLAQRISTIARVQVDEEDGLPTLICHICRHQVEKSYNFRLLVEISDRTLRNCLESTQADGTSEDQIIIKQEHLDKTIEVTDEENIDLEQFLLQNDLQDTDIDPSAVNVILVHSEDGTQVLNICSIDEAENSENIEAAVNIKSECSLNSENVHDPIASDVCDKDESTSELDDLEGIRQLLNSDKIYVQALESQIQTVYTCSECEEMFLTEDELNNHYSTEHGEDGEEIDAYDTDISCQLCFEPFKSLSELKDHITEHFAQHKSLDSIKSETDIVRIEEEQQQEVEEVGAYDTVDKILDDNYQYVLEVSKSDESYSETVTQTDISDDIIGDGIEDRIIEIDADNGSETNPTVRYEKDDGSVDLELNLDVANNVEYKSDIFYCVKEYLTDRNKPRSVGNYPCTQCDKTFTQKHEHTLHLRRHMGIKPFKCTFCDRAFITNALRKEHERGHTGDKAFVCVICGKSFVKKSELKYHEGIHTDTPSTCPICNKEFTNVQSFKMHTKRHVLGSRYVCETCGKSYYTSSELARHVQMHSGKREYPCYLCQTSFLSRPELNRHLKYHIGEKKFRCKICFKSYFESGHLKIHERVHTGEKPYICTVCNKAFVTRPKLVRHEKIHTKEIIGNYAIADNQCQVETVKVETIS